MEARVNKVYATANPHFWDQSSGREDDLYNTCKFPVQSIYIWGSSFGGAAFTRPLTLTP